MSPHHNDRDHPIVRINGQESAEATLSAPTDTPIDPPVVPPDEPTRRPSLTREIFTQHHEPQDIPPTSRNKPFSKGNTTQENHSSNTWTSSREHQDLPDEEERTDDREEFVVEYNRLAKRHGIRPLVPGDFPGKHGEPKLPNDSFGRRRGSWISKMIRHVSEPLEQAAATKPDKPPMRHQRSLSDVALNFVHNHKRDWLKNQDLDTLVRLCGKSFFFLPKEYAPCSLILPTCFRALAQALVQHADTKGIFRLSGSLRVVNALYDYYCADGDIDGVSSTTRCPLLPKHIKCDTHDVADTFKRFLAGLPGGILGSLTLFDALVAIHSQLRGGPELHWTKESKLRARLIAFAIGTEKSKYQRELICAVFGLLCLIGRVAETAPREDEKGRPLPTSDLMGYNALGIIFGPLLVGNLINKYSMKVADPAAGLVLLPISPPKSRKEKHHKHKDKHGHKHTKDHSNSAASSFTVDKVRIANSITEMLILHWREIVRQMRSIGSLKAGRDVPNRQYRAYAPNDSSSFSDDMFTLDDSHDWDHAHARSASPSTSLTHTPKVKFSSSMSKHGNPLGKHTAQARQARLSNLAASMPKSSMTKATPHFLSPTAEEETPSPEFKTPYLYHDERRATDLMERVQPMTLDARPDLVDRNRLPGRIDRREIAEGKRIAEVDHVVPRLSQSSRREGDKTSSPPLLVHQYISITTPPEDASYPNPIQARNHAPVCMTLSPDIKVTSPVLGPEHGHNKKAIFYFKRLRHEMSSDDGAKENQLDPKDDAFFMPAEVDDTMAISGRDSGDLMQSTTDLHLGEKKNYATPTRLLERGQIHRGRRDTNLLGSEVSSRSSSEKWKAVARASKDSSARSVKESERRTKRNSGNVSSRPSQEEESVVAGEAKPTTPEWKREVIRKRSDRKLKPTTLSPEPKSDFDDSPQKRTPNRQDYPFSDKSTIDLPLRWLSQRSASKPIPGSVKAMAALFDSAEKESTSRPSVALSRKTYDSLGGSNHTLHRDIAEKSPTKASPFEGSLAPVMLTEKPDEHAGRSQTSETRETPAAQTEPIRPPIEETPTKPLRDTLRRVKSFTATRKEPQSSWSYKPTQERERSNQLPRLGTMVAYPEEPPVGHFARHHSSGTFARGATHELGVDGVPRDVVGGNNKNNNSFLYSQIRYLQRQLELRNEEILQLRRQLETQDNMDIGTLCEQLRLAKRECVAWRKRAEAAERRVAVFERFTSRMDLDGRGEEDLDLEKGEDSQGWESFGPEEREVVDDRIILGKGGDGAVFEDYDEDDEENMDWLRRGRSVQTWNTATEWLDRDGVGLAGLRIE